MTTAATRRIVGLLALLLTAALCFPQLSLAAEKRFLDEYFARTRAFTADFQQTLFDEHQKPVERSSGTLAVKRPDRFRLEYDKPYHQIYVADGTQLWFYDEDLEQVTVKQQEDVLTNTPAMLLSNPDELLRSFEVHPLGEVDGVTWFELVPRKPGQSNFKRVALGFGKDNLQSMELEDAFGQVTRLDFHNIQRNPRFPAGTFRFTPPAGVDVLHG